MLTLYFHPFSFPSLGPLFAAEALGLNYTRQVVDLQKGEQSSPEYLAVNPYGRVPGLKDGDFCMGESEAILRYLARKEKSRLYPDGLEAQAKVDQWMDFVNHHVRANVGKVHFNRVLAGIIGVDKDEKSLADGLQFLERSFANVEAQLAKSDYLCGETLSLADIALVAALEPTDMAKIDLSPYPALAKWLKTQRKADYYRQVHTHYGAELGM